MPDRQLNLEQVLDVMRRIPRPEFVPPHVRDQAYVNAPLPIGYGQTISQPRLVAKMMQWVQPQPGDKALDVGTGSGYQAALLAELVSQVYSIEILQTLADAARARLAALGYQNIQIHTGDGCQGWPTQAPFDVIVVAAAADHIPRPLVEQLALGGRMVIPVGTHAQTMWVLKKAEDGSISQHNVGSVAFVPLVGSGEA
jgi:protein-L-isoaspartate(D-aspartate) O-methyltransferase